MGLASFLANLTGPRVKEISPERPLKSNGTRRPTTSSGAQTNTAWNQTPSVPSTSLQQSKGYYRNEDTVVPRPKSQENLKKRRSFFNGKSNNKSGDSAQVPALPPLPSFGANVEVLGDEAVRPGTAYTTNISASDRNGHDNTSDLMARPPQAEKLSRRKSLSQAFRLKRSKSTSASDGPVGTRTLELPPLPPMPNLQASPTGRKGVSEQAKPGRRQSLKRRESITSTKSKRRSWFQSSNPDDDTDMSGIPPVPALARSGSGSTSPTSPGSTNRESYIGASPPVGGADNSSQVHPAFRQNRRSYVPKNAAGGFLRSVNGPSEAEKREYRRSQRVAGLTEDEKWRLRSSLIASDPDYDHAVEEDDEDRFLISSAEDERRAAWAKLMRRETETRGPSGGSGALIRTAVQAIADQRGEVAQDSMESDSERLTCRCERCREFWQVL